MKGMVIYKSWWGSCKRISEAIGKGLSESEAARAEGFGRGLGGKLSNP